MVTQLDRYHHLVFGIKLSTDTDCVNSNLLTYTMPQHLIRASCPIYIQYLFYKAVIFSKIGPGSYGIKVWKISSTGGYCTQIHIHRRELAHPFVLICASLDQGGGHVDAGSVHLHRYKLALHLQPELFVAG